MRILFITRKYPPQIGGMEAFAYGLISNINAEKVIIALNKKQTHLIWWLPYALILSLFQARKVDRIHLCDGLLAPLGLIIKKIYHKPISVTVHGLDVTWPNFIYQKICVNSLKYLDKIVCVSHSTKQDCLAKNILANKLFVIPNGINVETRLIASLPDQKNKKILLTVGRLIKRKGVEWFVRHIMPKLDKNIEYWIVGAGPERENIKLAIQEKNLSAQVKMLGFVTSEELKKVYQLADIFIMPNIEIAGDREGFGIVALEANAHGLPVLASDLEGIKDIIINGTNGYLISLQNSTDWIEKIQKMLYANQLNKQNIIDYCEKNYSWKIIAERYIALFNT